MHVNKILPQDSSTLGFGSIFIDKPLPTSAKERLRVIVWLDIKMMTMMMMSVDDGWP